MPLHGLCEQLRQGHVPVPFQASKEAIIEAIRQGVEIFDIQRRTCLRPLTGPNVVSVTFSFSNTVVAPPVFQTAALGDGESHWPVPAS